MVPGTYGAQLMGSGTSPSTPSKSQGSAFGFLPSPQATTPMTWEARNNRAKQISCQASNVAKMVFWEKKQGKKPRKLTEEVGKVGSNKKTNPALITNN